MTRNSVAYRRVASGLAFATVAACVTGCAPTKFGPAVTYYADKTAVTDASARHTAASPYYRFDTALLDDLDDAIGMTGDQTRREAAATVLRQACTLAKKAGANEIERMPADARERLAVIAGVPSDAGSLEAEFNERADAALERDLQAIREISPRQLTRRLKTIRNGVEKLPDEQGRLARQTVLIGAAIPTAIGIAEEESQLAAKIAEKVRKQFNRVAVWQPEVNNDDTLWQRYAPVIAVEWPTDRRYPVDDDRIGAVTLASSRGAIEVRIDCGHPMVYTYPSEAKIQGRGYRQLNYVWWFPERPAMNKNDPAAGHIDGGVLRVTLGSDGRPMFFESSLNCGCGYEIFVRRDVEDAAKVVHGEPLADKRFSIEKDVYKDYDVVVVDTFEATPPGVRPLVLVAAAYHEVCQVHLATPQQAGVTEIVEQPAYEVVDYDVLDHLPLDGSFASMFGPDGLVHDAGRPEGYLLAPSGMLSAGQPRKRGTQRVRWDAYMLDDPHLLEETLRLPPLN
jgi:hypothetical protein